MSESNVYRRLQQHLDSLPVGFPATKSGAELRLLQRLFSEEEAELACSLSFFPLTVQRIARDVEKSEEYVGRLLEQMCEKGLIGSYTIEGERYYSNHLFVVGIYEYQLGHIDKELAKDFEEFMQEASPALLAQGPTSQVRVVPVQTSITPSMGVSPYENLREIIRGKERFSVMECICKKEKALLGEGCEKPREVCLVLSAPNYFTKKGWAREISKDEALEILATAEDAGLVANPGNTQDPFFICLCCGCCCGVLSHLKKLPTPSAFIAHNYQASIDVELCTSCETCLDRCQMDAITISTGGAVVDLTRCIGCGLCVSTCPAEAIQLERKEENQVVVPPASSLDLYRKIATEREKRSQ